MKTTKPLYDDGVYYVAETDLPGVVIGAHRDAIRFDIPCGHAWYDRVHEATTRAEVAALHRELVEAYE